MIALRFGLLAACMLGVLGVSAGGLGSWNFWAWVGVFWSSGTIIYSVLARVNPELLAERMDLHRARDRDRQTRRFSAVFLALQLVLTGLDARWGWSDVPFALQCVGLGMFAAGMALVGWVLFANPFASSAVRIQAERGQRVISSGPYAWVRHPMYLAVLLVCLGSGPALASWVSGLALLPIIALFIRRTLIEDRMLQRELVGYSDYAARVRYRVLPLIF